MYKKSPLTVCRAKGDTLLKKLSKRAELPSLFESPFSVFIERREKEYSFRIVTVYNAIIAYILFLSTHIFVKLAYSQARSS